MKYIEENEFLGKKRKVFEVEGIPFVEDISRERPFNHLILSNIPNNKEKLFSVFRKFGRIESLNIVPETKDVKTSAFLKYITTEE